MLKRFEQALKLRPNEWKVVIPVMLLLTINTLVLELSDVVAMAGFISNLGTPQLLWLWPLVMIITLLAAGGFALVVDRTQRIKLVGNVLAGFGFLYLLMLALFWYDAPEVVRYPLLAILSEQQYALFPLAFWTLANDLYSVSDGKRLFPLLAAGSAIGSLVGNGLAALITFLVADNSSLAPLYVLTVCASLCFVAWAILYLTFRHRPIRARQAKPTEYDIVQTFKVGTDVIRNVPLFSYLALVLFASGIALTVVEFHFLTSLDAVAANNPLVLQQLYGFYKFGLVAAILLFQWGVTSRWLSKINPKSNFVLLPMVLLLVGGSTLIIPIVGGLGGRFLARLIQVGWDEPARKSVQGIIPDERRGRVSVFLDSYCYAFATICGCILIAAVYGLQSVGWFDSVITSVYLGAAVVAALVALWAALRLRTVYDKSLLNWRLARSRRKSVLDGIDF